MARLLRELEPISQYKDRKFEGTLEEYNERLRTATTVYVGNLAFVTTEEQIYELFGRAGCITRLVMGLDRVSRTPCGFCFVEYRTRHETECAVKYLTSTVLDGREIRVDYDWGFVEGRQYGRGKSGGQVRDEYRLDNDSGRGGYGREVQAKMAQMATGVEPSADMYAQQPQPGGKRGRADLEGDVRDGELPATKAARQSGVEAHPRGRGRGDVDEDDDDA